MNTIIALVGLVAKLAVAIHYRTVSPMQVFSFAIRLAYLRLVGECSDHVKRWTSVEVCFCSINRVILAFPNGPDGRCLDPGGCRVAGITA